MCVVHKLTTELQNVKSVIRYIYYIPQRSEKGSALQIYALWVLEKK